MTSLYEFIRETLVQCGGVCSREELLAAIEPILMRPDASASRKASRGCCKI